MYLPDFYLPAAAVLPGVDDEHSSVLRLCQRRRQKSHRQSVQQLLVAIFGGACEREFGRTFTLQFYPEYLIFFPAMLFGRSLMPPMARCPTARRARVRLPAAASGARISYPAAPSPACAPRACSVPLRPAGAEPLSPSHCGHHPRASTRSGPRGRDAGPPAPCARWAALLVQSRRERLWFVIWCFISSVASASDL